jgi:DedD protein
MADQPELTAAEREIKRRGRRRLIGAITLGLLAFVFVPMFFDDEPKHIGGKARTEISVQIPQKEGQPVLPAPAPVVAPAAPATSPDTQKPAPEPVKVQIPPVEPPKEPPKETAKAEVKAAPPEKAPEAKPAPKAVKESSAAAKGTFAVQVGAFSDADKIKESIARIKEAGLPHYTETVAVSGGKVTRVRAGPFDTKNNADAALARIKLAGGDGKVVPK